jgi:hypothetical protein
VANAADIIVNLVAKTGSFQRGMDKSGKKLTKFQQKAAALRKTLLRVGGAIAGLALTVGVGAFARLVTSAIDANDEVGKMATTLGIATERLKGLQLAAELAGVQQTAFNKGIVKLGKAIVDAANGLTTYTRIFDRLNLTTEELLALSPDEQLLKIGEALAGIESSTERAAIAYDLFGGRNVQLVNLLANTSDQIEDTIQQAQLLGSALTGFDVARFEAAQDELTLIKTSFEGIRNQITIGILPLITLFSEGIQGVAKETTASTKESDNMALSLARSVGAVISMGKAMFTIGKIIVSIGLRILNLLLKPIELVEGALRKVINLGGLVDVVPANTLTAAFITRAEEYSDELDNQVGTFKGLVGEMDVYVDKWKAAKSRAEAAAKVIQDQRAELRGTSAELAEIIRLREEEAALVLKTAAEAKARQTEFNQIVNAGLSKSQQIAAKIAALNANLISGEFITTEKERNAVLETRARLVADLIAAQRTEAGLATAADQARTLAQVLGKVRKESIRVANEIAVVNEALIKGEGDRNVLLEARKLLIEELIQAQIDEQSEVGKITEIGLQALRNMQDIMADFFANTEGGFRGLLSGFSDMLRRMVAQLLARRVLLSFLGLFAGGSGSLAGFAQSAISGITSRQGGGPLAAGQASIVGEAGPELFIPKSAGTIVPNGGGRTVQIFQNNSFSGSGPLEPATLIPLLEENNRKLKSEFVDELRRGAFE